jgi:hypothetical protein
VDPGKHGHARNVIPGIPPSRNRIDDVTSGPPIPCADLAVPCLTDTSPAPSPLRLIGFSPTGDLTLCRKFSWVLTRCFESPSTHPPHPPQAHRTRRVPNACRSLGWRSGDFCYYLYHRGSIVGVILTILCVIFLSGSYENRLRKVGRKVNG